MAEKARDGAGVLRQAAAQARAEADIIRAVSPQLVNLYADDCGSERDARRHLAVADWLDFEARVAEKAAEQYPSDIWDVDEHALAVARAYLGSPS